MIKVSSLKRPPCNIMTKKPISSWPTVILSVNVLTAMQKEPTVTKCEKCGTSLSPTDLINPKSAISGSQPVMRETKHWYLPLDKHEGWLREWILENHKEWRPNVYGQCKSWLDMGLQPRAVSR
mgnify:FL=1